ncbi:hypothetical protein [Saccharospirillum sp.]|uniref:tripartite tricarboxylate transporter TctB family protein n=1 Tax=Saccharospirillum sp. TaxID=2033801 RepID=UPI0034A0AB78
MLGIHRQYWPEILFGVIGVAITLWLLTEAAQLPERAALFPTALLWCLLVVTAAIAIQAAYIGFKLEREEGHAYSRKAAGLLMPAFLLVAAGLILMAFGFYVTAPLMIFAFHTLHAHRSGHAAFSVAILRRGILLALFATLGMFLVFDVLIGLPAPSGTLF